MRKMIPDCFWPSSRNGKYVSHEAICVLNVANVPAQVALTLYFEERDKKDGGVITVPAERTKHIRMDQLMDEDGLFVVPQDTPYALLIESDQEIFVQYTRVDTTQAELALMTTMV